MCMRILLDNQCSVFAEKTYKLSEHIAFYQNIGTTLIKWKYWIQNMYFERKCTKNPQGHLNSKVFLILHEMK